MQGGHVDVQGVRQEQIHVRLRPQGPDLCYLYANPDYQFCILLQPPGLFSAGTVHIQLNVPCVLYLD